MQPDAIALMGFNRMAKGMPQVENGAQPTFSLIPGHNLRLVLTRTLDGIGHRFRVPRQEIGQIRLQPFKKFPIGYQAVFDHLGDTRRQLARR